MDQSLSNKYKSLSKKYIGLLNSLDELISKNFKQIEIGTIDHKSFRNLLYGLDEIYNNYADDLIENDEVLIEKN